MFLDNSRFTKYFHLLISLLFDTPWFEKGVCLVKTNLYISKENVLLIFVQWDRFR